MIRRDARLTLDIEKPAAGGRMLARHDGQVVLVSGAIPGERVAVRIERVGKGVAFADVEEVASASADRRADAGDWRCGGNAFAHIAYPRQLALKAQIIQDAFARIARLPLADAPDVLGSPEHGYRMRARLHVQSARIGFFREGSHDLCDAAATGQLLEDAVAWIDSASEVLQRTKAHGIVSLEIAENVSGDQRAVHLELGEGSEPRQVAGLATGLIGLSAQAAGTRNPVILSGTPSIVDDVRTGEGSSLTLRRDVRSFFQGNRFLLQPLVDRVLSLAGIGPVVDLYAGVGLFGLSLASAGIEPVTLVEGDPISGADLARNAEPFGRRVVVRRQSVETFLARDGRAGAGGTFIVDPPRTGMTREALAGVIACEPHRIVYVSCDVATLARDARTLAAAGWRLEEITGIDLFPNTAHVESIAVFVR